MKTFVTALLLSVIASTAVAETRYATITRIEPRYENVTRNVPQQRCENVEVPVYGTAQGNGASGGDVLTGMIIGGLLGKGVTGQDNGAAAGAVIGGIIAAEEGNNSRRVITGYRTERQCSEVMVRQQVNQIRDYRITYQWSNLFGQSYTYNEYRVGDRIPVTVSINAQ
jgi:uncharacterized protein YcfJ